MELQRVTAERKIQESELFRLQKLLSTVTKERDEAREQCRSLQERFILQQAMPANGGDFSSTFMHSSSLVSSPSSSPWSLQELEEHLNSDDFCPAMTTPSPFELQQALESLVRSGDNSESFISHVGSDNERDFEQEVHVKMVDQSFCCDGAIPLNQAHMQAREESVSVCSRSVRTLSRQSSSNSSSTQMHCFQRSQTTTDSLDAVVGLSAKLPPRTSISGMLSNAPPPPPPSVRSFGSNTVGEFHQALSVGTNITTMSNERSIPQLTVSAGGVPASEPPAHSTATSTIIHTSPSVHSTSLSGVPTGSTASSASEGPEIVNSTPSLVDATTTALLSSMGNNILPTGSTAPLPVISSAPGVGCMIKPSLSWNGAAPTAMSTVTPSASIAMDLSAESSAYHQQQATSSGPCQFHLPEPPEADPQVMLSSLPEKGKLLQAVMEAGPLLQTLLLAGPLPQWRYPPPTLSTRDIPKVSLAPSHAFLSPRGMLGVMSCGNVSSSSLNRKRIAIAEPCSQSKKLRKLSPSQTKKGSALHAISGAREKVEGHA
ncbi:hypothetical protein KP509_38G033600 [Ceratopteris richardii]|nr:hypothetical protein KP509_38G033600 [Ceratopteris richardii]